MHTRMFRTGNGVDFEVILLAPGERGPAPARPQVRHAIVQFYDARFTAGSSTSHGRLVSSYYLETILPGEAGIHLADGTPRWSIDAGTLNAVRGWLREVHVWSPQQARQLAWLEAKLAANSGVGADTMAAINALRSLRRPPF